MKPRDTRNSQKITTSTSQAFLLLLEKYQADKDKLAELKALYLLGRPEDNATAFDNWLNDPVLASYHIDTSFEATNADATRRYFETHLAHHTRLAALDQLEIRQLTEYEDMLYGILPTPETVQANKMDDYREIYNKVIDLNTPLEPNSPLILQEYRDILLRVRDDKYLDAAQREKAETLIKCVFLGTLNATAYNTSLPLKIYGAGIYSTEQRGKIDKTKEDISEYQARSQHLGIMKSYMPLARDDAALAETAFTFLKPSDQSRFDSNAAWVKFVEASQLNPFSNSISGTMLCQLRCMAFLKDTKQLNYYRADQFQSFFKAMTSAMLYATGGHTFQEFLTPLRLPEVRAEFADIPGFDNLDMKSILLDGNHAALDKALKETIGYNQHLLRKTTLHEELVTAVAEQQSRAKVWKAPATDKPPTLHNLKLTHPQTVTPTVSLVDLLKKIHAIASDQAYWEQRTRLGKLPSGIKTIKRLLDNNENGLETKNQDELLNLLNQVGKVAAKHQHFGGGSGIFFHRHKEVDQFYYAVRSSTLQQGDSELSKILDQIAAAEHSGPKLKR
jgi:hypothetical protein